MSMYDWAEQECRIACKRENPNFNFDDDKEWDYGCSCYKSALKAFKSLCDDGHSGASFGFTKNILIKMMEGHPLTPITDDDFKGRSSMCSDEYLQDAGLRSEIQCPRMSSLFRTETLDGKVTYRDIDRSYYVNIEEPSDTFHSWTGFLDEMFPITMPYMPKKEKFMIYSQTFLSDKRHGDFDTRAILYVITPENKKVDVGIYETEDENGKWKRITKEQYDELLSRRVDTISKRVSHNLLWTLVNNSSIDEEIEIRERGYKLLSDDEKNEISLLLSKECEFFESPDNWKYNTFSYHQALCKGDVEYYKAVPELVTISESLNIILKKIREKGMDFINENKQKE